MLSRIVPAPSHQDDLESELEDDLVVELQTGPAPARTIISQRALELLARQARLTHDSGLMRAAATLGTLAELSPAIIAGALDGNAALRQVVLDLLRRGALDHEGAQPAVDAAPDLTIVRAVAALARQPGLVGSDAVAEYSRQLLWQVTRVAERLPVPQLVAVLAEFSEPMPTDPASLVPWILIAAAVLAREPQNRKLAFLRALLPEALRRLDSPHLTRDDPVAAARVLLAVGSMLTAPATAQARRTPATRRPHREAWDEIESILAMIDVGQVLGHSPGLATRLVRFACQQGLDQWIVQRGWRSLEQLEDCWLRAFTLPEAIFIVGALGHIGKDSVAAVAFGNRWLRAQGHPAAAKRDLDLSTLVTLVEQNLRLVPRGAPFERLLKSAWQTLQAQRSLGGWVVETG